MSTPSAPPRPAPHRRPRAELSYPDPVPPASSNHPESLRCASAPPRKASPPSVALRFSDPAEQVALVARARRPGLLRAHRRLLRPEDLEDCFGQAVFELLAAAHRGQCFSSRAHIAHTLEQRFLSRVHDRLRAVRGRSPMQAALEGALPLEGSGQHGLQLADPRAELHPLVARRLELQRVREVVPRLTPDQRLVLATQVFLQMGRAEFCARYGWSFEKYRKVAQRARRRLRGLVDEPKDPRPAAAGSGRAMAGSGRRAGGDPGAGDAGLPVPELPVPPLPVGRNKETGTHL